jgi:hypothetical protein
MLAATEPWIDKSRDRLRHESDRTLLDTIVVQDQNSEPYICYKTEKNSIVTKKGRGSAYAAHHPFFHRSTSDRLTKRGRTRLQDKAGVG